MTFDPLSRDARFNSVRITCLQCKTVIRPPRWKFCSTACNRKYYHPHRKFDPSVRLRCKECHHPIGELRPSPQSHFCSQECRRIVLRRNWRNFQRRLRKSDLPQNGPAISSEERIERALKATGHSRRKHLILPSGWKDVEGEAFQRSGAKNGNRGKKDTLSD